MFLRLTSAAEKQPGQEGRDRIVCFSRKVAAGFPSAKLDLLHRHPIESKEYRIGARGEVFGPAALPGEEESDRAR